MIGTCSIKGCPKKNAKIERGMCMQHYNRWYDNRPMHYYREKFIMENPPTAAMGKLPLGERDGYAIVDSDVYSTMIFYKWRFSKKDGVIRNAGMEDGYDYRKNKRKTIYLHREVMQCPDGKVVDHINHDTKDNRRSNLRVCTQAQNRRNQLKTRGSSQYKGVSWSTRRKKWAAFICKERQTYGLGEFKNEEDAAIVYNVAAQLLHGQFAHLNKVRTYASEL